MVEKHIHYESKSIPPSQEIPNRVLPDWNQTAYPHTLSKCVHELFEEQVSLTPEAIAVEANGYRLTFKELNERANSLARVLQKRGIGPNTFVGICVERSLEMIVGIYGILKAGGAYVPLDPAYPQDRLAYMLQTANICVLLTQDRLLSLFGSFPKENIIRLDADWPAIAQEASHNLGPVATADHFIYLIFTSGTTGRPKGAAVYHRGFTNLLLWFVTEFRVTASDRNLLVSSLSFDLTQKNLYAPLIRGGRLHLAPAGPYDAQQLSRLIQDHGITLVNCTPSAFYPLIEPPSEERLKRLVSLRVVFLGGEPISIPRLRPWMNYPSCRAEVANTYGPTECTDICGAYRMTLNNMDQYDFVPLGRPIHNVQIVIVDADFNICPVGKPGELCVAGTGIGAGYINDPEMTATKFVSNPFPEIAGRTIYHTGDQARWLPDGVIEFLGRLDHQVKIRGIRIELHEIESVLNTHSDIRDAVVVVRNGPGGDESARLVCYVMPHEGVNARIEDIRGYLSERLPVSMVPAAFYMMQKLPLSPNGKVDRRALELAQETDTPGARPTCSAPTNTIERQIQQIWLDVLGISQVGMDENFFDVGGNSLQLAKVHSQLLPLAGREFPITDLLVHTTIRAVAEFLVSDPKSDRGASAIQERAQRQRGALNGCRNGLDGVAIVGMSGRFPGAKNVEQFWQNLVNGVETISRFRQDELEFSVSTPDAVAQGETFIRARAILEDVDQFDAAFFGIYPREAELMDPQHRLFLECAWEALEAGGYDPDRYPSMIGVYAGLSMNTYLLYNLCTDQAFASNFAGNYQVGFYQVMLGNDKDFMPTRVSYKLNLRGPSMTTQTACSTSLVNVCQACTGLLNYQCDMALAGGVSITFPQKRDYLYQEEAMMSADGTCRVFDAESRGTVFGHGVAVVLLKRLADAVADGDNILAVIKGSALNNDGSVKIGYVAPSVNAQAEVIAMAQAAAGVDPETISYIEAHGTGTPLGDPIEVAALTQAFRSGGAKRNGYCAIGTGKTHIGHIDVASGATGLIKTILQLKYGLIPPLLHFKSPNPKIDFANSPFYPVTKLLEWKRGENPRRAGVSAFGVGGTNAHVVVEEAPLTLSGGPSRHAQVLVLSAKTESALQTMTANLATHLENNPDLDLADVAFTLQNGRKLFAHRRTIVASGAVEATGRLRSLEARSVFTGKAMAQAPAIVFLFPGQGAQYLDMGRELYNSEAVFRAEVDRCATILQHHLNLDLRKVLYPQGDETTDEQTQINQTWLAQPAIFVVEYALARLWMSWGIRPAALIGHSIGEYAAAVLAEAFTLEDALTLLSIRARLMQSLPAGSMLAVRMDAEKVARLLPEGVSIAAVNSPALCVVSGPTNLIQAFRQELESKKIAVLTLNTSHAFHSAMMDPMLTEFSGAVRQIPNQPPKIPWVSTCTGRWMRPDDLTDGEYWVRQVRQTVRFAEALELVIGDAQNMILEVGPGQTLSQLAKQHANKQAHANVITSLGPVGEHGRDLSSMLVALGRLWIAGVSVDWAGFSATEKRRRIALPTYPFERKKFWIEPSKSETPFTRQTTECAPTHICVKEVEMQPTALNTSERPLRTGRLINELCDLLRSYTGADHSETPSSETFMDLGFDSMLLTQISQGVQKRFGVKVTFRQMLGDLGTLNSLAAYLDEKMPPETNTETVPQPSPALSEGLKSQSQPIFATPLKSPSPILQKIPEGCGMLESVIQQQLSLMAQHLELLRQQGSSGEIVPAVTSIESLPAMAHKPVITAVNLEKQSHFGPFKAIEKGVAGGLTERQQVALDKLIARYNQRTAKSKALAQQHRAYFCDPRAAGNFRQLWKEMVYPIVCEHSKGSHIWDIDGNEYIDVTMGFGVNYLGHSPDYVMQAVEAQMKLGMEIGPQSPLAGEVAQMICEFTGLDRATFCNTGSEAVMAAFRVARAVTGRDKIVYFYGDYHGLFDEVLGRPALCDGVPSAMPIAPGIPHLANIMILDYGNPSSLDAIRQHAGEIAAVIVEPVQARHPGLQPREFLQELRRLTREREIALIFDEVITGFRIAPGGAQEYFGVKADLATYGKVIGGGMPIGVLAGSAKYMDALDGGFWQYGDESSPPTGVTFFAGTFVRHPLAMAAAYAVLKHLKSVGPSLQAQANQVTARFVDKANDFFRSKQLPMQLQKFSTTFYYDFHSDLKYAGLLFYYLRDRGVHIWEGRVGHLSVAHINEDMDRVLQAFQESVEEMQAGGFLPETGSGTESLGIPATGSSKSAGADTSPITEAQKEIFFSVQMGDDANCSYNESNIITFNGNLDIPVLERTFLLVLERHPALRSTFTADGENQMFPPTPMTMNLPVIDLTTLPENAERNLRFRELCALEMRTPFDLVQGPLLRLHLVRLSSEQYKLIFTAHHMVCDGWSFAVVFSDLSEIYTAFRTGRDPVLAPAMSFADYARQMVQEESSEKVRLAEEYWVGQFSTGAPALELPTDHARPALKSFAGAMEARVIDNERFARLKKVSPKLGGTLFATVMSVFATLLNRLTGQDNIVIGIPAAGQAIIGCDELVGHCLNFLPVRLRIPDEQPFVDFAKTVKACVLDAYEHQDFTYGTLVKKLKLPRDTSRLPLVSVMFNIDKNGLDLLRFDGLEFDVATNAKQFVNFEIFFNLRQTESSLEVECEYNTDLFDRKTIQDWLESFEAMIEGVIALPQSKLTELPILGDTQQQRLLVEWNQHLHDYPKTASIHNLFEEQAKQHSEKVAVRCGDTSINYADLNRAADALAGQLLKAGTKPGNLVGLFVERSIDMVIGVLGILKSGAAYVPMDPSFPAARLGFMVEDSQMPIVVTQKSLSTQLPEHRAQVILMDSSPFKSERNPDLPPMTSGSDLAYVIYTSGSTGHPKGVQIEHHAVVNFLNSMRREPGLLPDDVLLSVTTLSFDIAGLELLLPLIAGATIVIARRETVIDGNLLRKELEQTSATVMQATPVTWRMLLEAGWTGGKKLKILIGGEAVPRELVNNLAPKCASIWNMYGPTETTIWSTTCLLTAGEGPVSIGRPIDNTQVYIVNPSLQLQPVGTPGELLIGGDGLARGYWNRPELTSEKFISDPFSGQSGSRLYRTGDLARWRQDGTLECLGRIDYQVKLRGFRIELGEIESALEQHKDIKQAVISLREDSLGNTRLVAYYMPTTKSAINESDLRSHLSAQLPDYMVPAIFIVLDAFPLTPNGKVDRKALPAPELKAKPKACELIAPRNEREKLLAEIWEEVLGLERVGIYDNFFELGGDSLLCFRVANRAIQVGIPLTPRLFFQHRTIADIIKAVESNAQGVVEESKGPAITRVSREGHKRKIKPAQPMKS
jgi:amino acid adenylation domain-containing protein